MRALLVLALLARGAEAAREFKKIHGDDPSIYDGQVVMSETDRVEAFHRVHGQWPDAKWLERETPGYTQVCARCGV